MMGKLAARDNGTNRQFKPQVYQSKGRGQVEFFMIHIIMTEEIIKIGTFSRNINNRRENRSISNNRSRSESRVSTNRDRIRCYKCKEYDDFMKDCPTSKKEREIEQLQQMFNLDEKQTY